MSAEHAMAELRRTNAGLVLPRTNSRALEAIWPSLFVMPLNPFTGIGEDARCTCYRMATSKPCTNAGKCPARKFNEKAFPNVAHQLALAPLAGYGICMGYRSGIFVVDFDSGQAIQSFEASGPCPETFTVRRGHSGEKEHRYFRLPYVQRPTRYIRNTTSALFPKCDVRAEGGFVVGPGSPHKSGETYWVHKDVMPAEPPAWLLAMQALWADERAPSRSPRGTMGGAAPLYAPVPLAPDASEDAQRYNEERLHAAIRYLQTNAPLSIIRSGGRDPFFGVCTALLRRMRFPFDMCALLIERYYLPRCLAAGSERVWTPDAVRETLHGVAERSRAELGEVLSFDEWRGLQWLAKRISDLDAKARIIAHYAIRVEALPSGFELGSVIQTIVAQGQLSQEEATALVHTIYPPKAA
jgi:hypothetical protein